MLHNFSLSTRCFSRIRLIILVIIFSLLISLAACGEKIPKVTITATTSTQEVVVTAWTAELIGELINADGCIRIRDRENAVDYAIVWTPDVSATIEGDKVRIISGIERGNINEIVLRFGDTVRVSGGETTHPDEQLLQNMPPNCQGPYWVIGFEIDTVQTTEMP
ncbi:MAG: hypothetical protein KatS3mg087_2140 [Patescibacteria group bacterium]|nr:MAG: hypothetical protein KatS3mg087_2140 [Patescibacteria group bacterium]